MKHTSDSICQLQDQLTIKNQLDDLDEVASAVVVTVSESVDSEIVELVLSGSEGDLKIAINPLRECNQTKPCEDKLVGQYAGQVVEMIGEDLVVIREKDILGILLPQTGMEK